MILTILYKYQDTASHDNLVFPSVISHTFMHAHVSIPSSTPSYAMIAISKESFVRSSTQLVANAKCPQDDSTPT